MDTLWDVIVYIKKIFNKIGDSLFEQGKNKQVNVLNQIKYYIKKTLIKILI